MKVSLLEYVNNLCVAQVHLSTKNEDNVLVNIHSAVVLICFWAFLYVDCAFWEWSCLNGNVCTSFTPAVTIEIRRIKKVGWSKIYIKILLAETYRWCRWCCHMCSECRTGWPGQWWPSQPERAVGREYHYHLQTSVNSHIHIIKRQTFTGTGKSMSPERNPAISFPSLKDQKRQRKGF